MSNFLCLYTYRILIYSGYMVQIYKIYNFIKENCSSLDSGLGSQDQNLHFKKNKQSFRVFLRVYGRISQEFTI